MNKIPETVESTEPVANVLTPTELEGLHSMISWFRRQDADWGADIVEKAHRLLSAHPLPSQQVTRGQQGEVFELKRALYVLAMELLHIPRDGRFDDEVSAAIDFGLRLGMEDKAVMFGAPPPEAGTPMGESPAQMMPEKCPVPLQEDDGTAADCIAKGHCGCGLGAAAHEAQRGKACS